MKVSPSLSLSLFVLCLMGTVGAFHVQKSSMVSVSQQLYRTSAALSSNIFRWPETVSQFVSLDRPCAQLTPGLFYSRSNSNSNSISISTSTRRRAAATKNASSNHSRNTPAMTERIKVFLGALFRVLLSPMKIISTVLKYIGGGGINDADVNGATQQEKADSIKASTIQSSSKTDKTITTTTATATLDAPKGENEAEVEDETTKTEVMAVGEEKSLTDTPTPVSMESTNKMEEQQQQTTTTAEQSTSSALPTPKEKTIGTSSSSSKTSSPSSSAIALEFPETSDRWAVASSDLSGDWTLIVTDEFKNEYDEYLKQLGQPGFVRSIALGIIGLTAEYTKQTNEGRNLFIRGTNARGVWERTLIASGAAVSDGTPDESAVSKTTGTGTTIITADSEEVDAEAWWESNGTVHRSWLRGVTKYGGGDFESRRYLEEEGSVLVCESTFHPEEDGRNNAVITWKFLRKGTSK